VLRQFELVERVRSYDPEADEDLLNRAYVFSVKAHGAQLRASGDPYFSHPIEVAGILTDLKLDDETIATAILHDTIEDTLATPKEIEAKFGRNIARLVDGVTKLSRIEAQSESERAAENFRKFLLAMSDDIRVLLVKLADRLHNMRTLHFIKDPEKRRRIARETMDIYAPLAERIGMYEFMDEMKQIAFRELEPEAYQSITTRLERLREAGGDQLARIAKELKDVLGSHGVDAEVTGREKRPFSIWRKMQERHIPFEQLSDVIAFRIIVDKPDDCYRALGIIHQRWSMVPGRFKDFISTPKRNGYRSLHTTIIRGDHMRVEIQVRTQAMHDQAEMGLAAHWAYKQDENGAATQQYPWLSDLLEILDQAETPEELMEHAKLGLYQDQVFCFTPKGELIQLPRGSTPVDFAYAVHTKLGETTVGAKVNGRVVPLRTQLANGDQVEILRSNKQQPDPLWESFVATAKARAAIRRFTRHKQHEEQLALGERLLADVIRRLDVKLGDKAIDEALKRLGLHDRDDLVIALATHKVDDEALIEALLPGRILHARTKRKAKRNPKAKLSIKGLTPGVSVHLANCCHPIPGDRIIGIRRQSGVIDVHTIDCSTLADADHSEWLDLGWGEDNDGAVVKLSAVLRHEPGSLATMTGVLAKQGANIVNLRTHHRDRDFHTFVVDVEVDNLAHLTNIVGALRATDAVTSVERMKA
jgi:GTP diphosphokinase / guanosine-3',5'-bis(diphosphate) 3'-diphosphatase